MTEAVAALIAELEAAARAAWQEEQSLRARMTQEVTRLERRRAFAHRRINLVRILAAAAAGADAEEVATAAQRAAVRRELGWDGGSEFQRAVLDRLRPAGLAVWRCARAGDGAEPPAAVHAELEAFETWFESAHRGPFYALFDREPPEVSLVET
jgi:hypothetical protein